MTDDEAARLALLIRPKDHLFLKWAGALAAAAGIAWGVAKWAATTPTREEHNQTRDDIVRIRIELPTMNARIERGEQALDRIEKSQSRIENKLEEKRKR